jgi:hypothetical protein
MEIWTGLACLKANPKVKGFRRFGRGKGAYVNVVACAASQETFQEAVKRHAEQLDCILVELDEVQLLETRMSGDAYPEEFIDMRQTATRQPNDMVFGCFHIWEQDESN